jgi:ATP-binding cassette subfamily F protein 3
VRTLLGGFGFSGDAVEKPVRVLSGGEKVRLAFARLLIRPPNLLLLDEPTTHLDIHAREALEDALAAYEGTLCMVSHDVEFVRHVATGIIAMTPPGITRYPGGYDYYREKSAAPGADRAGPAPAGPSNRKLERRRRAERLQSFSQHRRRLERDVARAEKEVARYEREQQALLAEWQEHPAAVDHKAVQQRLTELQEHIDRQTRAWENVALRLEQAQRDFDAGRV